MVKLLAYAAFGSMLALPALAQMPQQPPQDNFPTILSPEEFSKLRMALGQLPYDTAQPFVAFLSNAHEQSRPKPPAEPVASSVPMHPQQEQKRFKLPEHQASAPNEAVAPSGKPAEAPKPEEATPAHPEPSKP